MKPRHIRLLITLAIILIFLLYFTVNKEEFRAIQYISIYALIFIGLLNITSIFVSGLFTKYIVLPFHKYISIRESFYISVISSVGNFFATAGAGAGIRAIYLRRKYGLHYVDFLSTLSGNYLLVLLVNSAIGLIALAFLSEHIGIQWLTLLVFFSSIILLTLSLIFLSNKILGLGLFKNNDHRFMSRFLKRLVIGWAKISSNKSLLVKLTLLVFCNFLVLTLINFTIIKTLGLSVDNSALLLLSVLGGLTIFINITPANLGVKEAVYIFSSAVLGLSLNEVLLIALVDRGVQFAVLLLLWVYSRMAYTDVQATHPASQ